MAYCSTYLSGEKSMKSRFLMFAASCLMWAGVALAQVNINSATRDQLDGLKGIGPTKAQAIIDYRRKNGPFKSVDDLENVPGIGPETLKDLRGDVVLSGTSRAPASTPAAASRKEAATQPSARPAPASRPLGEAAKPMAPVPAHPFDKPAAPASKPAALEPARPAATGMPAKPVMEPRAAPDAVKPATPVASAAPARPAMPGKPAGPASVPAKPATSEAKPAVPSAVPAKPASPATKPAGPAVPGAPAKPASPAQPAAY
jgi:competence protein ComEA